jgi:transcriptional regulator with XRE-family HTH domain
LSLKNLGITLKKLRKERGLTQAQLAERADVHRIYIAQIEAQTKMPSLAALERIAKALKVKVSKLLE